MMHTMEEDIVAIIMNNLGDSNVQQLVNYIITDQDDIGKCFKLEGALKAEIDAEFNQIEKDKLDFEYEEDDEDAMSTSSGYCSGAASSIDYYDSEERMSCSYPTFYMDEKSQCSDISMCSSNSSLAVSELALQEVNRCIMNNAKFIQKQLQQLSIRGTKLKNIR